MIIGIVAGEPSGDRLGAGLMREMRARHPAVEFVGIGGSAMREAGLESLVPIDRLSMNGLLEPVKRLPELVRIVRLLLRTFRDCSPAAFIGVDFNVFNFIVERLLKRRGMPTAHYVSPSVYAWRPGRVRKVARCADLLLTLYPFEPAYYENTSVRAVFVGHPLADEIELHADPLAQEQARDALGVIRGDPVIAVLPGSRSSEIGLLLETFLQASELIACHRPETVFVLPCMSAAIEEQVRRLARRCELKLVVYRGDARAALTACDAALVKSGTGSLEAMLLKRPMVVSYRLGWLSYVIVKRLLRTPYVALPNILAGRRLVPELLQDAASAQALASAVSGELDRAAREPDYLDTFHRLHRELRHGADSFAAQTVLNWLRDRRGAADAV